MWQVFSDGLSVLTEKWLVVVGAVIILCLAGTPIFFFSRATRKGKEVPRRSIFLLVAFFTVSVILRLVFLTGTFVPPYFDSVEHYRIIKALAMAMGSSNLPETIPALIPSYYHIGFHFLAELLTFGLRADPMDVILVLGQVILAAIPIPILFLIREETHSDAAAFFGALLAGFGWYMPGFAVNWGKYPALAGLLALEFVLGLANLVPGQRTSRLRFWLIPTLILSIILAVFLHTRTLVVIVFALVSWLIARGLENFSKKNQLLSVGIFLIVVLILGYLIWQEPLLHLALEPYLKDGLWVTVVIAVLSPFAFVKFPRDACFGLLLIGFVFAALFIPISPGLPGLENQTLLDRPFVEMFLYLPLSFLGGLGLAGLLQTLKEMKTLPEQLHSYAGILTAIVFLGFAVLIPVRDYNFYPSDCCKFVSHDDIVAFDWLEDHLPSDAHILVAGTQLSVLPSGPATGLVGTDGGIWIPALTGRNISYMPFNTDFSSSDTLDDMCRQQISYIYVGSTNQKFDISQLQAKADWYEAIFSLPNVQIYRIKGCSQ